jgi:hypothetical protein
MVEQIEIEHHRVQDVGEGLPEGASGSDHCYSLIVSHLGRDDN